VGEEKFWCSQWGSKILFSHGTSQRNGVAILFPSDLQCNIKHSVADDEGRVILTEVEVEEHEFILCNIYAPTKDKPGQQKMFLDKLKEMLAPYIGRDVIIGGDYNICQFPELDKKGGKLENQLPFAKDVISFKDEFELVDIWRLRHPTLRRFTRRERSIGGYVQSRLDYWLISKHLEYVVVKTDILPGRRSDHSLISLKIELQNRDRRGKGFWKLNTSLLKDELYLKQMRDCISECKEKYNDLEDKRLLWDVTKCEIRSKTISYACHKSKINKQMEKELTDRVKELEILLAEDPSDGIQAEYSAVTTELNSLLSIKTKGAMLRSRAKWVEEGEKIHLIF
jgi:exonuclease III